MNKPSTITAHYDCNDLIAEANCGPLTLKVNHYREAFALHYFWAADGEEIGWTEADATYCGDGHWRLAPCVGDCDGYQANDDLADEAWDAAMLTLGDTAMNAMYIVEDAKCGNVISWFSTRDAAEAEIVELEDDDRAEGTWSKGYYAIRHNGECERIL